MVVLFFKGGSSFVFVDMRSNSCVLGGWQRAYNSSMV
jgi:hypothetical protein